MSIFFLKKIFLAVQNTRFVTGPCGRTVRNIPEQRQNSYSRQIDGFWRVNNVVMPGTAGYVKGEGFFPRFKNTGGNTEILILKYKF